MTKYEELRNKAEKCRQAAIRAENESFKNEWLLKAAQLENEAANLPLVKAAAKN